MRFVNYLRVYQPLILLILTVTVIVGAGVQAWRGEFVTALAIAVGAIAILYLNQWLTGWLIEESRGRTALARQDFAAAEAAYRKGLERSRRYGDQDPRLAILLDGLGQAMKGLGDYTEAESLAFQALKINEHAWGPNHFRTMVTVVNFANIYLELARYDDAAGLYRRALDYMEQRHGPKHRHVGICLNNLGRVFSDRERYAEAEPYYRRAYEIMEATLRPTHLFVGFMANNLGGTLARAGKVDEAEPYAEQAAAAFDGKADLHEALALTNLGYIRLKQGRLDEAEENVRTAYALNKKMLGGSHPLLITTLHTLADVFRAQGRSEEAEEVCERQLHLCENYLVPTHPSLARCLEQYAALAESLGRPVEAQRLRERAQPVRACFANQPAFAPKPPELPLDTAIQ